MAFEQLNRYTDILAAEYQRTHDYSRLFDLADFYRVVLKHPKFRGQRAYCAAKLREINPHFFEGCFGGKKINPHFR